MRIAFKLRLFAMKKPAFGLVVPVPDVVKVEFEHVTSKLNAKRQPGVVATRIDVQVAIESLERRASLITDLERLVASQRP